MTTLLAKEIFHPAKTSDIVTIFDKKPDSGLDLMTGFIIARFRHNPVKYVVKLGCDMCELDVFRKLLQYRGAYALLRAETSVLEVAIGKDFAGQLERIIVEEGWNVRFEHAAQAKQLRRPAGNEVDPTASVSFNLRLTEEEKSARNNVKLPHTRGSGVIYYEPDEADDIDYEDPDE